MYGIRSINNAIYAPGGRGDSLVMLNHEYRNGRLASGNPQVGLFVGTSCKPRKRPHGPKPPTAYRVSVMRAGKWDPPSKEEPTRSHSLPQLAQTWSTMDGNSPPHWPIKGDVRRLPLKDPPSGHVSAEAAAPMTDAGLRRAAWRSPQLSGMWSAGLEEGPRKGTADRAVSR
eukprot:gnl/TRDRNA2_/TRDRNA2_135294_c0_seq2.p1 gnl/TRDRNA2_/TRDRNA2_135294_c0~~gnl/TRDRNA2_/TRDRNA2_135294_c0_seq2.p1  ORF type:complete len:190 (+),score=19.15 gnl/TRDRNA2_/TRDRNA2_135294_c0_seq2:60-572(+)